MIDKIEFHKDGSIKAITFIDAITSQTNLWLKFTDLWNKGDRMEAFKLIEEYDKVR